VTYGQHHAQSADALSWLLTHSPEFPRGELPVLLSCRRALLAAQRERCERAVRGADVYSAVFQQHRHERDLIALARGGTMALRHLLDRYPSFEDHTVRFTDALQADSLTPYAQAWTEAARHAVLATEAVVTSSDWTEQPGQAWQVVADISDVAEAMVAIDRKLARSALAGVEGAQSALLLPTAELRLAARHTASVARAGDFDPAIDGIHLQEPRNGPIAIRRPGDLLIGARATERLLRDSGLSVPELRSFALIQADIAHTAADLLTDSRLAALRDSFRRRDEHFRNLAGATARVAGLGPSSGRPVLAQSQEVGRFLLEVRRSGRPAPTGVLADFDAEQPRLATTLATNIRRDLNAGRYLVVDDDELSLRWRRTEPGERAALERAVDDLPERLTRSTGADVDFEAQRMAAQERAARTGTPPSSADRSRDRLRSTLDREPYGRRPLTPNRLPSNRL
jgi:hypothetical protein